MIVLKYGGNAMGAQPDSFLRECAGLLAAGQRLVLVHGGGPQIDAGLRQCNISERRVAGLRVTDRVTLDITERVLCGTVNKALVRALHTLGIKAVGISGEDGGLLLAQAMPPVVDSSGTACELGFVGEVTAVQPAVLQALLDGGFLPVVAPLGISVDGSTAYNLNADTAAGAIAGALRADPYIVITDVPKVRRDPRDPATGIDSMSLAEARRFMAAGSFDGGMLPKMQAIFTALETGAQRAIIAGGENAVQKALSGDGTTILADT
jgi:acetylglutamate kinase